MTRSHSHPCRLAGDGCLNKAACWGDLERNWDGEPAIICSLFHLGGGQLAAIACPACAASRCADCGATTRLGPHDRDCLSLAASEEIMDRR